MTRRETPGLGWTPLAVSAGLSLLFIVVYGTTNWLASVRPHVPSFFFGWERSIPFIPLFALPYLSIDLFFVSAPFLCRSAVELRTFALRIAAAILVAGVFFVMLPLRCGFPGVAMGGWLGSVFASFLTLDRPFNQLPSLHAALGLLLFDLYFRKTRGLMRGLICFWFSLMALSPLLTHQHQVADLISGAALAGYCFYVFRADEVFQSDQDPPPRCSGAASEVLPAPSRGGTVTRRWGESFRNRRLADQVAANFRIAFLYAGGAVPLLFVALLDPRHWAILAWPGISLCLVSVAYLGAGPRIFRKRSDGTLPLSSLFALGPCIFGQFCSLHCYRRKTSAYARVTAKALVGCRPGKAGAKKLIGEGVTAVLDLCAEFPVAPGFRSLRYLCLPVLDLTAPTPEQLELSAQFIAAEAEHGQVYVHCKIGYSRSVAAIAAWLLFSQQTETVVEAIALIRRSRPGIVVSADTLKALEEFSLRLRKPSAPGAFLLASAVACGP